MWTVWRNEERDSCLNVFIKISSFVGKDTSHCIRIVYVRVKQFVCCLYEMCLKRDRSLNSSPTSTESELRLLSAPSVRFWKQTTIFSVSLWALIVELYPLNWESAQAFRPISDKVTMKELEEQRVGVRNFSANLVKILHRHFSFLNKHMGRNCLSRKQC
jgi:hypothetical protein